MLNARTTTGFGRHAHAQFRCQVCQRFVRATKMGLCPSCGAPPVEIRPLRVAGETPVATRERMSKPVVAHRVLLWMLGLGVVAALAVFASAML